MRAIVAADRRGGRCSSCTAVASSLATPPRANAPATAARRDRAADASPPTATPRRPPRTGRYETYCAELSGALDNAPVLSVQYRLAPAHGSIQQQVEDALCAYRWFHAFLQCDPPAASATATRPRQPRIVVMGDSAGGGLAALLLQRLAADAEAPPAVAGVLISPWLEVASTGKSMVQNRERDLSLSAQAFRGMHWGLRQRPEHSDVEALQHPSCSALRGEWAGLPPTFFWCAEAEALRDDAVRGAEEAAGAGVEVELVVAPWAFHETPLWVGVVPEAATGLRQIAAFCRRVIARGLAGGVATTSSRL